MASLDDSTIAEERNLARIVDQATRAFAKELACELVSVVHFGSTVSTPVKYSCDIDILIIVRNLPADDARGTRMALRLEGLVGSLLDDGVSPDRHWHWSVLVKDVAASERFSKLYLDMLDRSRILHDPTGHMARLLSKTREWVHVAQASRHGTGKGSYWVFPREKEALAAWESASQKGLPQRE